MAVSAEPYRNALFLKNLTHAVLHELVRHVEVLGRVSPGHVAQMLDADLLALDVLLTRIVHQADIAFQIGGTHILLPELDRRDLAIAVELAILVGPLPIEALRRLAQVNRQNTVTGGDRIGDDRIDRGRISVHMRNRGVQHAAQLHVHLTGVLGGFGLREQILRHRAILLVHVHGHGPLAAVAHHVGQQMLHQTRIGRLAGLYQSRHVLQEVVDAFQLVVVHGVVLGELELLETHVLLGYETGHVQRAEQPATAGTVLMGDGAVVHDGGETTLHQTGAIVVARHLVDAGRRDGVHGHAIVLACFEIVDELVQFITAQWRDVGHYPFPFYGFSCSAKRLRIRRRLPARSRLRNRSRRHPAYRRLPVRRSHRRAARRHQIARRKARLHRRR